MNKAYIELLDSKANAVLLYMPDNCTLMVNFLQSKFPDGNCKETGVWAESFSKIGGTIVIWFREGLYMYDNLIEDLQMLDYNIVQLDETFDMFEEMLEYIKENNL